MANIWQSMGIWEGGTVLSVAISPHFQQDRLALAATAAGLYCSRDGGHSWSRRGVGLTDPNLVCLHFTTPLATGSGPGVAFVASQSGRLFQSRDGGESWQEVAGWQGLGTITALASSPTYGQDQTIFAATAEGVFRSQDEGATWESSTFGLLDLEILCLAVAPTYADNETLWAGSAAGGLYRSRNGARSWRDSGDGLPDTAMLCLALAPAFTAQQTLYVGTEEHGIYHSTDSGASWQELSPDLAGQSINALAVAADGQTLIAGASDGILRSTDGGQHWQATDDGQALVFTLALAPDGSALAGAFLDGILHSTEQGAAWQPANQGLAAHAPPVTVWDHSGRLFALDREGVFAVTADGGAHWPTLNHLLDELAGIALAQPAGAHNGPILVLTETALVTIAPAPEEEAVLVCTDQMPLPTTILQPTLLTLSPAYQADQTLFVADASGQLFCSTTGGAHWEQRTTPAPDQTILQLAFAPDYATSRRLYAVTTTNAAPANYPMQLWLSQDQGDSWSVLADFAFPSPALDLAVQATDLGAVLWLGAHNRVVKFSQQPDPQAWTVEQSFLADELRITRIIVPPAGPLYVTTTQGIYVNATGHSWEPLADALAAETWIALHCDQAGQPRYAVSLGGHIWRAGD